MNRVSQLYIRDFRMEEAETPAVSTQPQALEIKEQPDKGEAQLEEKSPSASDDQPHVPEEPHSPAHDPQPTTPEDPLTPEKQDIDDIEPKCTKITLAGYTDGEEETNAENETVPIGNDEKTAAAQVEIPSSIPIADLGLEKGLDPERNSESPVSPCSPKNTTCDKDDEEGDKLPILEPSDTSEFEAPCEHHDTDAISTPEHSDEPKVPDDAEQRKQECPNEPPSGPISPTEEHPKEGHEPEDSSTNPETKFAEIVKSPVLDSKPLSDGKQHIQKRPKAPEKAKAPEKPKAPAKPTPSAVKRSALPKTTAPVRVPSNKATTAPKTSKPAPPTSTVAPKRTSAAPQPPAKTTSAPRSQLPKPQNNERGRSSSVRPPNGEAKGIVSARTPSVPGTPKSRRYEHVTSKINASSEHRPQGGHIRIFSEKKTYQATSKIGSLENAKHVPGGGNVQIQSVKTQFKETAKPRIDNKGAPEIKPSDRKIPSQKLNWKADSKIGSLQNARHVPGGGNVKILSKKPEWKAESKVGSRDNIKHVPGGGDKKIFHKPLRIDGVRSRIDSNGNASTPTRSRSRASTSDDKGGPGTPRKSSISGCSTPLKMPGCTDPITAEQALGML